MKYLKKFNESNNQLWKTMSWDDIIEDLIDIFIDLSDKDVVKEIKHGTYERNYHSSKGVSKIDVDYFYITIYLPGVLEDQIGLKGLYKAGKGEGGSDYKTIMNGYISQTNLLKERLEEIYNCIERSNNLLGFMPGIYEQVFDYSDISEGVDKYWVLKISYERTHFPQ